MTPDQARREMSYRIAEQCDAERIASEWEATCTHIGRLEHQISVLQAQLAHARDVESNLAYAFAAVTTASEEDAA